MDIKLIFEFLVTLGALMMGARMGGVGLGLWGAVGYDLVLASCWLTKERLDDLLKPENMTPPRKVS